MFRSFACWQFGRLRTLAKSGAFFASLLLLMTHAFAGQATLAWDANTDPAVAGYMVHYGQVSGSYTSVIDAGRQTGYTVPNLQEGRTYYYVVTAYDSSGAESAYSNQASAMVPYTAPAPALTPAPPTGSFHVGETSILNLDDRRNSNLLLAQKATLSTAATLQSLSFYVTAADGSLRLGVYDATGPNGGPGAKVAETNTFTAVTGWNTANVITQTALAAGTYWIAYLPSSDTLHFVRAGGGGPSYYYPYAIGPLPATFSTSPLQADDHWSFYATLSTAPPPPPPVPVATTGMIAFVQANYAVPQTSQTTVAVPFSMAQTAGNLNIVVVGWNDTTATVSSVTDSQGNTYARAVGPTKGTGITQAIYYAPNIKAGTNRVTVNFSIAAVYVDVRVLEYSGVNAVDVTAAASGSSATSSTGAVTTTNANDLIFGANTVATSTAAAGTGFRNRVITLPDGNLAEDAIVTATGSYNADAALKSTGPWVMQLVAFKRLP